MPLPSNFNAVLGAGVFGIVCAATLYVVEHYRQERRRHGMAKDLQRLNTELACVRQELNNLMVSMNNQYFYKLHLTDQLPTHRHFCRKEMKTKKSRKHRHSKAESIISSASEDYTSALDSSDLEFYDVSDEDDDTTITASIGGSLDDVLVTIDEKLDNGKVPELEQCLETLRNLCIEHPENPHLLWRIGKAHYRIFEKAEDVLIKQDNISKGLDACNSALTLLPELAEVHKWIAILVGARTKFQPMKEKILDGYVLKNHVDAAIKLSPNDPALHHMLGRFCYEISELKWYERKIAATLFADPPSSSYEEALGHFLRAEEYSKKEWKDNKLFLAKCKIKLGNVTEGVKCLEEASLIEADSDEDVNKEIEDLLKKYKSHR